jgi:endoglucanase
MAAAVVAAILPLAKPAQAAATRYEAESAAISGGVVESNHTGFTGTGFVNYDNATGSYVEWAVNAATAGTATIVLRFANGTTTDRPMDVSVNGTTVTTALSFPGTGTWDTWQTKTVTAAVNAGTNRIRAVATTSSTACRSSAATRQAMCRRAAPRRSAGPSPAPTRRRRPRRPASPPPTSPATPSMRRGPRPPTTSA